MTSTVQNIINIANNDKLADQVGMVYQIWNDGEITLQKSGELFGLRSMHTMHSAIIPDTSMDIGINWPHQLNGIGFAFVTGEDAEGIRKLILKSIKEQLDINT